MRILGFILALIGAGLAIGGYVADPHQWVLVIIGAIVGIVGLFMLIGPGAIDDVFDGAFDLFD